MAHLVYTGSTSANIQLLTTRDFLCYELLDVWNVIDLVTKQTVEKVALATLLNSPESVVYSSVKIVFKGHVEPKLQMFKDKNITPMQIRTDHHTHVCTYMREKEPGIDHQFDMWHFVKNIKKKLINASQKASCKIPSKWVKSIGNHLW